MIRTVGIVSLSSGVLGEEFVRHEVDIGLERLRAAGLRVRFMPHALKGLQYIKDHPEARAADLTDALRDPEIDMILCAIGGDDTYRLAPYLFDGGELEKAARQKVFLGFSDTTIDHFMLHKVGMKTFYGQSFLADVCEIGPGMYPYSQRYFDELTRTGTIREITPADTWYEERKSFAPSEVGTRPPEHRDLGFELLQGPPRFSGKILGGCIDSMLDMFDGETYPDMPVICRKYGLFPPKEDWEGRILLIETSEVKMPPDKYRKALEYLKEAGVFAAVSGVLVGKPMDRAWENEYREALRDVTADPELPILCNINIGHAQPRCIIPLDITAHVDAEKQVIRFGD